MKGTPTAPFSELFQDTLFNHGMKWCYHYYVIKHKMALAEFGFWIDSVLRSN